MARQILFCRHEGPTSRQNSVSTYRVLFLPHTGLFGTLVGYRKDKQRVTCCREHTQGPCSEHSSTNLASSELLRT